VKKLVFCLVLSIIFLCTNSSQAGDLDDGIELDHHENDDLQLGTNVQFITQNAIKKLNNGTAVTNGCNGTGNINVAPGTNLKGATIVNMSNNKNNTTVCGK